MSRTNLLMPDLRYASKKQLAQLTGARLHLLCAWINKGAQMNTASQSRWLKLGLSKLQSSELIDTLINDSAIRQRFQKEIYQMIAEANVAEFTNDHLLYAQGRQLEALTGFGDRQFHDWFSGRQLSKSTRLLLCLKLGIEEAVLMKGIEQRRSHVQTVRKAQKYIDIFLAT